MNIIEAWKLAKDGQTIQRKLHTSSIGAWRKDTGVKILSNELAGMHNEWFLADDWEIVKEHRKIETIWSNITPLISPFFTCEYDIPKNAKVTIEWDE